MAGREIVQIECAARQPESENKTTSIPNYKSITTLFQNRFHDCMPVESQHLTILFVFSGARLSFAPCVSLIARNLAEMVRLCAASSGSDSSAVWRQDVVESNDGQGSVFQFTVIVPGDQSKIPPYLSGSFCVPVAIYS